MNRPDEPPPLPVRAIDVFIGFFVGGSISWGLRGPLLYAFGDKKPEDGLLVALFLPTLFLIAAIVWAIRTRRKAWAIGMSIYLGVGALVFGPIFALWAMCAGGH